MQPAVPDVSGGLPTAVGDPRGEPVGVEAGPQHVHGRREQVVGQPVHQQARRAVYLEQGARAMAEGFAYASDKNPEGGLNARGLRPIPFKSHKLAGRTRARGTTDMPGPSTMSSGISSKTIFTGTRCTTLT